MTDTDERLLTAAKLAEQARGEMDSSLNLHTHAGAVSDRGHRSVLSFLDDLPEWHDSDLAREVVPTVLTEEATTAVEDGDAERLANIVGVTEADLTGSSLRLPLQLDAHLTNNDATAFVAGVGNPNTGKTNLVALLAELRSASVDDLLVISNSRSWNRTDIVATSARDLTIACLEHRERPKFVFVDEGSTHFDARTNSREVATQFTPLAKRFAKIGVDVFATVGHTGKDLHPEVKRLVTLAFFKHSKKDVDFYKEWPADADMPTGRLFGGTVEELEPALDEPNPDDAAPWEWNLDPDLWSENLDWDGLLDQFRV